MKSAHGTELGITNSPATVKPHHILTTEFIVPIPVETDPCDS